MEAVRNSAKGEAAMSGDRDLGDIPSPASTQTRLSLVQVAGVLMDPMSIVKVAGTATVCAVGVLSSIASYKFTTPLVVDVASSLTMGIAPLVLHQTGKLEKLGTHAEVNESMKRKVGEFKETNEKLTAENDELEAKMIRFNEVQRGFEKLVDSSKLNADSVIKMVKDTNKVHEEMQFIMKARMIQEVLSILMRGDRDGDFQMGENELEIVILRIANQPGIRFDEERFRHKLKMTKDHSIRTLLAIIHNLMDDNPDDDDLLFSVN